MFVGRGSWVVGHRYRSWEWFGGVGTGGKFKMFKN